MNKFTFLGERLVQLLSMILPIMMMFLKVKLAVVPAAVHLVLGLPQQITLLLCKIL